MFFSMGVKFFRFFAYAKPQSHKEIKENLSMFSAFAALRETFFGCGLRH